MSKCKKCGTTMIARGKPFMGTIFGKGGHNTKRMSQFTVCPKCGTKGIDRL
jgi:predicted RNA-binding Zn-ribbon protein involved in translation (DUF1610 family)